MVDADLTRTSEYWKRRPGNWDLLNRKAIFPGEPPWDIPAIARDDFVPSGLVAYNDTRSLLRAQSRGDGDTVHFFLDDYHFEAAWTTPQRALARVQLLGQALAPDFSVMPWMPTVMQAWQIYRARWVTAYWQWRGVRVLPVATWADCQTYELAWTGLPRGGVVAISAVGITTPEERQAFRDGLHQFLQELAPSKLVVYGGLGDLADGLDLPPRLEFPTLQEQRGWRHRARSPEAAVNGR